MQRRRFVLGIRALGIGALALGFLLAASHDTWKLDPHDLSPKTSFGFGSLKFTMTDVETGKTVTAADFRGKIVMLYFGYTYCPDICPTTLSNIALVLKDLGDKAKDLRGCCSSPSILTATPCPCSSNMPRPSRPR